MKLYIKNMVCPRCIMVVEQALKDLNLPLKSVELGLAELLSPLSEEERTKVIYRMRELGFELLQNKKQKQVEEIKTLLIKAVEAYKIDVHFSVKKYLSAHINKNYSFLSKLFSEEEGLTIEHYFILLKVEKVKELLSYEELSLNEISNALGYSSVQYLSYQFKKVVGISATAFKKTALANRKTIDQLI